MLKMCIHIILIDGMFMIGLKPDYKSCDTITNEKALKVSICGWIYASNGTGAASYWINMIVIFE